MALAFDTLVSLDRRAVEHSAQIARRAAPDDLTRPTPCAGWRLADLLAHMAIQHKGFAAASRGEGATMANWRVAPLGAHAVEAYEASCAEVVEAFARISDPETPFALPEIPRAPSFPARIAVGFHFIDYVVHAWDVAACLGVPYEPESDLLDAALPIALAVPTGPAREAAGAAFAPQLPVPPDASTLDRVLLALGRTPEWTPEWTPRWTPPA